MSFFAASAPGLETITAQELRDLNFSETRPTPGGVEFSGSLRDLYRANLHLRTAGRILIRIGEFDAAAFYELRERAKRLPWEKYLIPAQATDIKVTCHKSKLYHSGAVAERIAGAIQDRIGASIALAPRYDEDTEAPAGQMVFVRLVHDHCTVSIDSSGALLHQRGYRLATAKAPLRETLAAGILLASGWDKSSPLLDPFCGSGTIPIEAALLAQNRPPGRARRFAFMSWPDFDAAAWAAIQAEAEARLKHASPVILASDRDAGAIEAAHGNAARAGVAQCIEFTHRAVSAIEPPSHPGWVVTNPPYGLRVRSNQDLRNLYAQFGHTLRAKCAGWQVAMLCAGRALAGNTGLQLGESLALVNGGLRVKLMTGKVSGEASRV